MIFGRLFSEMLQKDNTSKQTPAHFFPGTEFWRSLFLGLPLPVCVGWVDLKIKHSAPAFYFNVTRNVCFILKKKKK